MEAFAAQIVNGLSLGSIYALLATGFNILLLVASIIHFSYPYIVIFSMYAAWAALAVTGNNLLLGCLAAVGSSVLFNVLTAPLFQKVTGKRAEADINATMVMSLGMGMMITEALSHGFNLGLPVSFPGSLGGEKILLSFGMASLSAGQASAFLASGAVVVAFFLLVYKTRLGREFRAVAEDPKAARIAGIPLSRTGLLSFALAGLLGGITALLLVMLLGYASAGLGEQISQKVLAVSIIAGLGNLAGGLVVGLMLGILEAIVQGYVAGTWSNAIAFGVMLAVILARPKGLFGSRV